MPHIIREVDATYHAVADVLHSFNALVPEWPALEERHLSNGYWWLVYSEQRMLPVAMAGMVPFDPFDNVGYCKRCYIKPDARGEGLQLRLLYERIHKAREIGWKMLVSECHAGNSYSASNFRKAGFEMTDPEQKWGARDSIYWVKSI